MDYENAGYKNISSFAQVGAGDIAVDGSPTSPMVLSNLLYEKIATIGNSSRRPGLPLRIPEQMRATIEVSQSP